MDLAASCGWCPSTRATYWAAYLSTLPILGLAATPSDKAALREFDKAAACYSPKFPKPMRESDMVGWPIDDVSTLVEGAFVLGQRISDFAQLETRDVSASDGIVRIIVRHGKVVPTIGAYMVAGPAEKLRHLLKLAQRRRVEEKSFMFSDLNSTDERETILKAVKTRLSACNAQLELRSIRRGGLQLLAAHNPLEMVLLFSKHRSREMLLRYLDFGL